MAERTFVKVCGLDTPGNVTAAVEAGADALGFVWWEGSHRHQPLASIAEMARTVETLTVLVTVDLESDELLAAAAAAGVKGVQPHGANAAVAAAAARRLGYRVIRPTRPGDDLTDVDSNDLLLVDTPDAERPGGTGRPFDWSVLKGLDRPYLLAGGLSPDTVAAAVEKVRPFGVDASSALESSPGVKDADLIRRFVEEAKSA